MALSENQSITGRLYLVLYDQKGNIIETRGVKNLITTAGKKWLARYFSGKIVGEPQFFIAVGSDETAPGIEDTALKSQVDSEQAETLDIKTEVAEDSGVKVIATVTATLKEKKDENPQELREAGIFIKYQNGEDPVLYNRVAFPVVNKSANMRMTLTWEVIF